MLNVVSSGLALAGLCLLGSSSALAQSDGVTLTVTPGGRVAITVSPNFVDFGVIAPGESGVAGPVTIGNAGTSHVQLAVQYVSTEAECDEGDDWTASMTVPSTDRFVLQASLDGGAAQTFDSTGLATLLPDATPHLPIDGERLLSYELFMPTAFGSGVPEGCRIETTVIALASGA
jgi:hypothetical protein